MIKTNRHPGCIFKNILRVHRAKRIKGGKALRGWLKMPPEVYVAKHGGFVTISEYVKADWGSSFYDAA